MSFADFDLLNGMWIQRKEKLKAAVSDKMSKNHVWLDAMHPLYDI
jgi:hypothetical protein